MFLQFTIKDIIDILLVALFIYAIYTTFKHSGSKALFSGILTFFVIWIIVSQIFQLRLMGAILNQFVSLGFFVLVILFQGELRKMLTAIGSTRRWRSLRRLLNKERREQDLQDERRIIAPLMLACMNMARKKTGALIAIQQGIDLTQFAHTGEVFRAEVNARLIENIFFKNSPLHDGAMVIADNSIIAAGCILPVAYNTDLNKDLGLRHRSALGLSQETDAKIIIISEERGRISFAYRGEIHQDITTDELQLLLED